MRRVWPFSCCINSAAATDNFVIRETRCENPVDDDWDLPKPRFGGSYSMPSVAGSPQFNVDVAAADGADDSDSADGADAIAIGRILMESNALDFALFRSFSATPLRLKQSSANEAIAAAAAQTSATAFHLKVETACDTEQGLCLANPVGEVRDCAHARAQAPTHAQ